MVELYGISNCDTIKKARKWLLAHDVDYTFHDYKKEGVDADILQQWIDQLGWQVVLNKRGTTWRKLAEHDKQDIDANKAHALLLANPSMIKRPILSQNEILLIGFSEAEYAVLLE